MVNGGDTAAQFSPRAKLTIVVLILVIGAVFLLQVRNIAAPFLWALVAAYLLAPVINYLNIDGRLPRLWCVTLVYLSVGIGLLAISRYLYPRAVEQGTLFLEDVPRLEAALISRVGPRPLGIDIDGVIRQILNTVTGYTSSPVNASNLLENALQTFVKLFLFLVTTFYLLLDGPRLRKTMSDTIPESFRPEIVALGRQINLTWQQYIRGELLLFVIMATATTIGLSVLQVPGALFLGLASGLLELLPLIGPWVAGGLAVSVAYFNPTIPWSLSQIAYAGVVALMYFVFRQLEDYFVIPKLLGRAVRLHPVVVLFALATMGVLAGLFGLLIAVPLAASLKAIGKYLYSKLLDLRVEFEPVRTISGAIIEIPLHAGSPRATEADSGESPGASRPVDAR
jgi:predicted PurR-regulated permease PerM